jgi:hypothetical protein
MTTFTNREYHVDSQSLQKVFQKHNLRPEYPIDVIQFVKDINEITFISYTQVFPTAIPTYNFGGNNESTVTIVFDQKVS